MRIWIRDERSGAEVELDGPPLPGDVICNAVIGTVVTRLTLIGTCVAASRGGLGQVHILWSNGSISSISADSALACALIALR